MAGVGPRGLETGLGKRGFLPRRVGGWDPACRSGDHGTVISPRLGTPTPIDPSWGGRWESDPKALEEHWMIFRGGGVIKDGRVEEERMAGHPPPKKKLEKLEFLPLTRVHFGSWEGLL